MTAWELTFFSVVQGIGEFLPISSSGHLFLLKKVLHLEEIPLFFAILLHVATLAAVLLFFGARVSSLLCSLWQSVKSGFKPLSTPEGRDNQTSILFVLIASVFTGAVGLGVKKTLGIWESNLWISAFFLVTATLLIVSHFLSQRESERPAITLGAFGIFAVMVGVAQGIGTLPGISRSGITIATLLLLRFPRGRVAELSFLMSVPAILGAVLLDSKGVDWDSLLSLVPVPALLGAMGLTFVIGYISLALLKRMLDRAQLVYFSIYLVGIAFWGFLH